MMNTTVLMKSKLTLFIGMAGKWTFMQNTNQVDDFVNLNAHVIELHNVARALELNL